MTELCGCTETCERWSRRSSPDGDVIIFLPYVPACVDPNASHCKLVDLEFGTLDPTHEFVKMPVTKFHDYS